MYYNLRAMTDKIYTYPFVHNAINREIGEVVDVYCTSTNFDARRKDGAVT